MISHCATHRFSEAPVGKDEGHGLEDEAREGSGASRKGCRVDEHESSLWVASALQNMAPRCCNRNNGCCILASTTIAPHINTQHTPLRANTLDGVPLWAASMLQNAARGASATETTVLPFGIYHGRHGINETHRVVNRNRRRKPVCPTLFLKKSRKREKYHARDP